MSVALLVTDPGRQPEKRMLPVATQQIFRERWLPGATKLSLDLVELMETGFDVTATNRDELVAQLGRLREWMIAELGGEAYELERLDGLVTELRQVQFDDGVTVFLG